MGKQVRKGMPVWVAVLIGAVAIVLALVVAGLLLWFEVFKPARTERSNLPSAAETTPDRESQPAAEGTPNGGPEIIAITTPVPEGMSTENPEKDPAEEPEDPTDEPEDPTEEPEDPTEEPENPTEQPGSDVTSEPTADPTAEPTAEPTSVPTPEITPAPTKKPDSFTFGGKTIKAGTKKIDGSKLGINGKSGNLRHITEEEVENLVELCPALEELSLDYCYMDDYEPLGALTKLKTLKLRRCNNGGKGNAVDDIEWVEDLKNLTYLHLGHNEVDDVTPLKGLKKLKRLNLAYNNIENDDLKDLSGLTTLTELSLYGNKKISDVSPLASLTNLTYLQLGYNSKLKSVKSLTGLSNLKKLRVNKTKISDVSYFKNFKSLEKLDISGCPIKFKEYYKLWDCKKLNLVVLDHKDSDGSLALDDMINNGFGIEILYDWPD